MALAHRAAHDPAQHVAALLVRGHHAVGHQEGRAATVVGDHSERAGGVGVLAPGAAGELLGEPHDRAKDVGLEDRLHALEDRRHALHPEAGVDVLHGQLGQRAVLMQVELHEHQVPELDEALRVVAGTVVLAAEGEAAIEVELRARPAGTGRAGLPEVVVTAQLDDALVRDADRAPALDRLLVRSEPELVVAAEDADPDVLRREREALSGQLPRVLGGAPLEVVADREVAEHLEEGEVALGRADDLDVDRAKALLAAGEPARGRLLLAAEVGLERLHAGGREQHGGIVNRGHERGRGQPPVIVPLEEGQELLADLGRLHGGGV